MKATFSSQVSFDWVLLKTYCTYLHIYIFKNNWTIRHVVNSSTSSLLQGFPAVWCSAGEVELRQTETVWQTWPLGDIPPLTLNTFFDRGWFMFRHSHNLFFLDAVLICSQPFCFRALPGVCIMWRILWGSALDCWQGNLSAYILESIVDLLHSHKGIFLHHAKYLQVFAIAFYFLSSSSFSECIQMLILTVKCLFLVGFFSVHSF